MIIYLGFAIVAQGLHPSNENSCVETLVKQAQEQGELKDLLFDAGFFTRTTLDILKDLNALIPKDKTLPAQEDEQQTSKYYPKSTFQYDTKTDTYTCPQGNILSFVSSYLDKSNQRRERKYTSKACASCPVRDKCTKSQSGRTIKRYEGDELKEAMLEKMSHEANKELYKKRSAWVEPVFSYMRNQMKFNRFKRKGLKKVRLEFSLQAMAYNITRAVALGGALYGLGGALKGLKLAHMLIRMSKTIKMRFIQEMRKMHKEIEQIALIRNHNQKFLLVA